MARCRGGTGGAGRTCGDGEQELLGVCARRGRGRAFTGLRPWVAWQAAILNVADTAGDGEVVNGGVPGCQRVGTSVRDRERSPHLGTEAAAVLDRADLRARCSTLSALSSRFAMGVFLANWRVSTTVTSVHNWSINQRSLCLAQLAIPS